VRSFRHVVFNELLSSRSAAFSLVSFYLAVLLSRLVSFYLAFLLSRVSTY
jgi:hypothetical protein